MVLHSDIYEVFEVQPVPTSERQLKVKEDPTLRFISSADVTLEISKMATVYRRKAFAPGARPRHGMKDREVVILRETLPSPAKKPRLEPYHEERRQFSKPAFREPETRSVNPVRVIEKKPVLNTAAVSEWRALPQRNTAHKRQAVLQDPAPKKPVVAAAKPVVKSEANQKQKEVLAQKEAKVVKEVPVAKEAKVVKEVPVAKEVSVVKEAKVVKEVPVAKEVSVVKEAKVVKEVPVAKEAKVVKEIPAKEVNEDAPAVKTSPAVNEAVKEKKVTNAKPTPTVQPNEDGLYELDATMASILHEELAQIMIKVWQELPDSPTTEPEELVVDKFRTAAGDDLQNALGLTITSRLLNIHNPLYAKLHFSGKPEAGCLQSFIREYNISAFKRIADKHRDTFAARFEHVEDFDSLCVNSEVKCGSATVTITPCYKYLTCPPSIKTIYADSIRNTKKSTSAEKKSPTNSSSQKPETQKSSQSAVTKNNPKTVNKEDKSKTENSETPVTNTSTTAKTAKATQEKPKPDKTSDNKVPAPNKVAPKKAENKIVVDQKSSDKSKVESEFNDEMMVVDEMGEEDDEEMTDQDILALMSGGIVLDECSASDEEK